MSETALKLLVTTLVLLWLIVTFYSSTAALIKDLCSQVRQLSYLMRCAVFAGLLLVTLYGGSKGTNTTQQSTSTPLIEQVATFFSGTTAERGLDIEWDYLVNPESLLELTSNQCVSGLALVSVSTNPAPAYWATDDLPTNMEAHVNPAWLRYGIAEDGYWINSTDENNVKEWSYCIGGQEVESLFISSTGTISISVPAGASASHAMPDESGLSILAPLWGPFGVVPALGSCVWSAATTNGGLLVCWNNVLIGRSTNNIASFQAELHWNGDVEFRYALPDNFITSNHVVGVQHVGGGESVTLGGGNSALSVNALSLFFRGFTPFPYGEWDLDKDGIPANEEVYLYGTSPTHFDSDFDGISDSNEVANARNPLNPDENGNGIVDGLEISFYGEYDPDDIDPRDGLSYGYKIANKLDPARDCSIDSDGDGFPDWQEELAGTDPNNGQSTPEINQGESILTDITITLGHPLPAPVMLTIGPRKIMMRAAGSWVLTLPQGVAHDISLSATQPCSLKLGAELSSNRALLLDTSGVFTVAHPADDTRAPSMMSTTVPADAVYISGRKQCGIFARPQVKIKPPLVCFHASHPKTVEAVVTPELEGAYQWIWLNNGAVSAPAARVTNISWAGGGTADGLVISFHPTGAAWATFGSDTIYRCIHADDPESEDDDIEEHGDLWCSVHQQEYWRCAIDYPGQPECDHGSTTAQYPKDAGRPLAVNNDDDDGDGVLDLYDTDGVIDDDDFIKIYPFSPYTGGCCPCPSHNPSASTTATRIYCSPRLKTWRDAAKTTQCTSVGRGEAVYVEGTQASTYIGGDKIIWSWSEDGETYARTNTYTIFSLRMFGDLNFDNNIDSIDYAAASSLTEHGWGMPVASNTLRKVELKTDLLIPGHLILSLTGDAQLRVWTTATPTANDTPLLVTGQTITNGVDGASFGAYPSSAIYIEAISSGTATLGYNYVGTGEHATGLSCSAALNMTAVKVELCSVVLDSDGQPYIENGKVIPNQPIGFDDVRVTTYVPLAERGTPQTLSFSDSESNTIVFEPDGSSADLRISRSGMEGYMTWELTYTNTAGGVDYYLWNGASSYVHVAFSNNTQACTSTVYIVIMDEGFTGQEHPVTNFVQLYSDVQLPGYYSNYLISEPREDVGMPAFSDHNAFVVKLDASGISTDGLSVSIETPDETYDIPLAQHSDGSYVSCLVVPVPYEDGDVDLGFESAVSVVKLKLKKDKLYGWDKITVNIESLGTSARKIASGEIKVGNAMLITGVVSNEKYASMRASKSVVEAGEVAKQRLKYGVTPIFTPTKEQIVDQIEKHSIWIHSGHGGNNAGIQIVEKVGSKYKLSFFKSSDINVSGLTYDLVFMNTCESTDRLVVPEINMLAVPPVAMNWKELPVTSAAVMDIGTALNAKNYIGWDTWVQRELSVIIPKMLMEEMDTASTEEGPRSVKEAVDEVKERLERDKPKYYWFHQRLNLKTRDDSVIMDLNKKQY